MVGQITCREHTWDRGFGTVGLGHQIAAHVRFQDILDQFIGRCVADGNEHALAGDLFDFPGLNVFHADAFDALRHIGAEHLVQLVMPERFDLGVFEQPILKDLFRPQFVAAVDQGHLGGKVRQEQRFFHSGVAATDYHDFLTAIKEPVTGRAGRNTEAFERVFRRKTQPFCAGSGGKDQSIRCVNGAAV